MKRYKLPERCSVQEIVVRELLVSDELTIAAAVDKLGPVAREQARIQLNEAIRHSIVEVDGVLVNIGGVPYAAFDSWNNRTMRLVTSAFLELNSVEDEEVEVFRAAGVAVESGELAKEDLAATARASGASFVGGNASRGTSTGSHGIAISG